MPVGGDIIEVTYNHSVLGSGVIYPKASEDSTFDLGGFRSNDDANMIDGAGNMIDQMNRVRPSVELTIAWDMNQQLTLEKIVALAGSPIQGVWTYTHVNGSVYQGGGKPVGDLKGAGNASTFSLKIAGGGTLIKIA